MNNLVRLRRRDQIREEASVWVVRLKEGLTTEQERNLNAWLGTDSDHGAALIEVATAWDELDFVEQLPFPLKQANERSNVQLFRQKKFAAAAIIALCVLAGLIGYNVQLTDELPAPESTVGVVSTVYDTAIGEQSNVVLPDGSTASLNTNSKVSLQFSDTERQVVLIHGEVFFEVKPDEARPFLVLAGDVTVRAVGTAFNVRLKDENELEVVVNSGKVVVSSSPATTAIKPLEQAPRKEHGLSAGQMMKFTGSEQSVLKMDELRMKHRLAWTSGMLIFDGQSLEEAISELSRYTTTRIIIADPSLADIEVAGYFKVGDVDALLFALAENFDVTWERSHENLITLKAHQ